MIVDTIRKTHPKGIPNGSLDMLISAIGLVAEHVPVKTRDLLTTNWMSDKSRPVKKSRLPKTCLTALWCLAPPSKEVSN
jgi:hypothetical protein